MANPRVPFCLSTDRPPLVAPPEGAIIVHLVVNVEHWPFDQPMPRTILTPPHGKASLPDLPNFSWVDYGMRAGLPRILEALSSRGLPASTSFNASVIEAYPSAAVAMRDAGWEFIGHGVHQRVVSQGEGEAEMVEAALAKLAAFTGARPRGWLSPGLRESYDSLEIFKRAGIDHVYDWVIDDLPSWLTTEAGPILALPYNLELNDSIIYAVEKHSSPEFLLRLTRTLALFGREAQRTPRVLALGLHPHLIGVPHRFGYFEEMLDLLMATPGVCFMTGSAIADWFVSQCPPPAS